MIFSSYEFIFLFLPLTFFIYFYLNKKKLTTASKGFLALSSLFFYSWWNIIYLPLILGSIVINYLVGSSLVKCNLYPTVTKKTLLVLGIVFNLSLLGYFKYSDFFVANINLLFSSNYNLPNVILPLAISFFTFQQIAYLVDSYKNYVDEYSFLNYVVFVSFFPQLIAGPIVHHHEMMPQFSNIRSKVLNHKNISLGIFIFSIGLFKKVVIADSFAIWATNGFDVLDELNLIEAWITSLSYTFQLYFDFSGYTDMAIGLALLFNIRLPINFNSPYKSINIRDFWKRWHITLSRFLRDYVYIPMGGNRNGSYRLYTNLLATFLIGGLWHGAGWTFVFWGLMHAIAITTHRIWSNLGLKINKVLAWFLTFNFLNLSWIFFRAEEWKDAIKVLKGMAGFSGIVLPEVFRSSMSVLKDYEIKFGDIYVNFNGASEIPLWILIAFWITLLLKNSNELISSWKPSNKMLIFVVFMFLISLMHFNKTIDFIYFNF